MVSGWASPFAAASGGSACLRFLKAELGSDYWAAARSLSVDWRNTLCERTPAQGADPTLSSVDVKSTPDGAEITVDDKYMGSTPSVLRLAPGDHKIKLEKSGCKTWERTMAVAAGGNANINVTLDKE
jgi:hypothetical protein